MFYPVAVGKQDIVRDGLVLWLDANDKSSYPGFGTTWNDLTPGDNNGTLTNGPTFDSADGGSIVFDGVDDYATIPHNSIFNVGNYFTVSLWVYPKKYHERHTVLLQKSNENAGGEDIHFRLKFRGLENGIGEVTATGDGDYDIRFGVSQNSTRYIIAFGDLNRYLNQWNHMVGVCDGDTIKLFWNAEEKVSYTGVPTITENTSDIRMSYPPNLFNNGDSFQGNTASVSIYNKALTAQEILQNYNATKDRFGL